METVTDILRRIAGERPPESFVAEVDDVRDRVCDVLPLDGATLKNVRLNTELTNQVGLVITPVKGSKVLVTKLSELDSFVSLFSEIEQVELLIGNTSVTIKDSELGMTLGGAEVKVAGDKFLIKNGAYTLKKAFNELIAEINAAIITTPAGPGNIAPVTVTKLTEIDNKINGLLN